MKSSPFFSAILVQKILSLFLATKPEKIIFGVKKNFEKFWSLFTAKKFGDIFSV